MPLSHFAPPSSPSLDQQRDALRKGLGRAVQWATTGQLDDDPLLAACLQDMRYDVQVEDSRGEWLWRMIREVGAVDRFRVPILHALYELSDERSANQLCELARCYAETGDQAFRTRLYEIVEQKPIVDSEWLGEQEIIGLDGEQAFLFAARVRGQRLAGREWEWDDDSLVDEAIERFGEERVNVLLDQTKDGALRSFQAGWQRQKHARAERGSDIPHREVMRGITVQEILSVAESSDSRYYFFRRWGTHAEDADLELILQHLSGIREPTVIANLLQVFANREPPRFDARLVELCRHGDAEVRRRALGALKKMKHPLVREFALSELEEGTRGGSVVGLFIRNYQQGDERRILAAIESLDDDDELHWPLMDVIMVLEANLEADCSQLGVMAYASTPCEMCRFDAAGLLFGQHVAPGWLTDECRFDSSERTRGLVAKITGPPQVESE